LFLGNPYLPEI